MWKPDRIVAIDGHAARETERGRDDLMRRGSRLGMTSGEIARIQGGLPDMDERESRRLMRMRAVAYGRRSDR